MRFLKLNFRQISTSASIRLRADRTPSVKTHPATTRVPARPVTEAILTTG